MYMMGGKQYLLVAAASCRRRTRCPSGAAAAPAGPIGWVAYALPERRD